MLLYCFGEFPFFSKKKGQVFLMVVLEFFRRIFDVFVDDVFCCPCLRKERPCSVDTGPLGSM